MRKNTPFLIKFTLFFSSFLLAIPLQSQYAPSGADEVVSFLPGIGQNTGQTSEYFPRNVLGLPDTTAQYELPATSPEEICSLGFGGEITLSFHGKILVDGPGKDFTVFENAFYSPDFKKIFLEPAIVSVSKDGRTFIPFPYDTQSLKGCAGITPINGDKNPFNPSESGGDSFDLADIGIDSVRYIRIKDISSVLLNRTHPFYDPIATGFDLDAVVGLHLITSPITPISVTFSEHSASIRTDKDLEVSCYSLTGQLYSQQFFSRQSTHYSFEEMPAGVFVLVLSAEDKSSHSSFPFVLCP
jgi:hypothetical protein